MIISRTDKTGVCVLWPMPYHVPNFKNEAALQSFCNDFAGLYDVLAYKWSSPGNAGVPDMQYIFSGLTIYVEFKHPNGEGVLSELQDVTIGDMRRNGAIVYVCDDFYDFQKILSTHFNR